MPPLELKCIQCESVLEEGFIPDRGDHNFGLIPVWVEGLPESSFWTGLKTKNRRKYSVRAMRCPTCGRLELFADQPV